MGAIGEGAVVLMCKINPEHLQMLRLFGGAFLVFGAVSIYLGATYYRRVIRRSEEPVSYWANVTGLLLIGGLSLAGTVFCPVS